MEIKLAELFSGIGSQARALENIGITLSKESIICDWNIHSIMAYNDIHKKNQYEEKYKEKEEVLELLKNKTLSRDGNNPLTFNQMKRMDVKILNKINNSIENTNNFCDIKSISVLENFDLLTYSFPCQDISAANRKREGIQKHTRSGLLYEVERIIKNTKNKPKFLLMENVPLVLKEQGFKEWEKTLEEMGYYNYVFVLNAKDFGIPQNRKRAFMISSYNLPLNVNFITKEMKDLSCFLDKEEHLEEQEKACPRDTTSREKIFLKSKRLNEEKYCRTITKKQDRLPNAGIILFNSKEEGKSKFRYLTPRECWRLMGFKDEDFNKVQYLSNTSLYELAGNSIVVDVLEEIFKQMFFGGENK